MGGGGGAAVRAGNIGGPAGAPQGSSVIGVVGGREPPALALPLCAAPGGSASEGGGGVVRGSSPLHSRGWRVRQAVYAVRDSRGITDGGEQRPWW